MIIIEDYLYEITFPGEALGGTAIVMAENSKQAKQRVLKHIKVGVKDVTDKHNIKTLTIKDLFAQKINTRNGSILYFDDGDY